jgi:hypothetical protein
MNVFMNGGTRKIDCCIVLHMHTRLIITRVQNQRNKKYHIINKIMRVAKINCRLSIGEAEVFYPEREIDEEATNFLKLLIENQAFLNRFSSFIEDDLYIQNTVTSANLLWSNNVNFYVYFNSKYTNRVVEKIIRRNFYHYLKSGGIWQYHDGGEIGIVMNNFMFGTFNTKETLEDHIEAPRHCNCPTNAYLYLYDKDGDLERSECINFDKTFNLEDYLFNFDRNYISSYKITDVNHNLLELAN